MAYKTRREVFKKMKRNNGLKCMCGEIAEYKEDLSFNGYKLDGWECKKCGEAYFNPEKAQKILLLNKLQRKVLTLKLSKVRSNKIMRIPKDIDEALGFGSEVRVKIEGKALKVMP